jgi:hypothetical protein
VQKRVGPDRCLSLMEHFLLTTSVFHKLKKIDRNLNIPKMSCHPDSRQLKPQNVEPSWTY